MTNNTNQIPCDFPGVDINLLQSSTSSLSIDKSSTTNCSRVVTPPTVEKNTIKVDTETRRVSWNCPDTTNDINPLDVSFEEFQKERRRRCTTAGLIGSTTSRRRVSTTDIMADWNENDEVESNKERKESLKRQREIANKVRKDFNILRKRISDMEEARDRK